jgi:phage gpG-like protein
VAKVGRAPLQVLIKTLKDAAQNGELYERMKKNLAAEALTQLQLGFRESRDPYGEGWKPPRWRAGKPLLDTGRLRNSFTYAITATGFHIGTNVIYAAIHNYGGIIKPKKGRALRVPVPVQGPAPLGAGKGRAQGIGHEFLFLGAVRIPRRQMVPSKGNLGPIWTPALTRAAQAVVKKFFGR